MHKRLICLSQCFKGESTRSHRRLFVSKDDLPTKLLLLFQKPGVLECLILSTCLRFEVYLIVEREDDCLEPLEEYLKESHNVSLKELSGALQILEGEEVVRHIFAVACGLDSNITGEKEIVAQIKNAYRVALESGTTGPVLNRLFQKSLNVSKRARSRTGIDAGTFSLASLAVNRLCALYGKLDEKSIFILGAGQIGKLVGRHLSARDCKEICFFSRSLDHARATAEQCGAGFASLNALLERTPKADILVTATAAPHQILSLEDVREAMKRRGGRELCIVDLAEPPDVDGLVSTLDGVTYLSLKDFDEMALETKADRAVAACEAWSIIEGEIKEGLKLGNVVGDFKSPYYHLPS